MPTEPITGAGVLDRMVAAYRGASTYTDNGQGRLRFDRGEERIDQPFDFSVTFARPNKLRMRVYQAAVASDGKHLRATVADLSGQVLNAPAPQKLTLEKLYADPVLNGVLNEGIAGASVQLALLLGDDPLAPVLEGAQQPELLSEHQIDGDLCHRVRLKRPDGVLVFWVDQKTFVLRRLDYPITDLEQAIEREGGGITRLALVAEFKQARLNPEIDEAAFQMEVPAKAKLVDRFDVPPKPAEVPSELLGKRVGQFTFMTLDGQTVTRDSLAGKIVVIDFWATWCNWCFKGLPLLEQVHQQYKDQGQVAILAVSTDEPDVPDRVLQAAFTEAGLTIPISRDWDRYARDAFGVEGLPTTVILGTDGTVQSYEQGFRADLATALPTKLDKLLAGQNLYDPAGGGPRQAELPDEARQTVTEIPQAPIADRSQPASLKLTPLWTCRELKTPGNILVVPRDGEGTNPQLLVHDGWRAVVELGPAGQVVARHELDIPRKPDEAVVSYIRTAKGADGRRYFVGSASNQQQFHLFDADWKRILSHPDGTHAGITDVQLADLDGDGEVEINVGYWGQAGVHNVSLDGRRRWFNRSLEHVLGLAVTGADRGGTRRLLVANGSGPLVPIDHLGREGKPLTVGSRFVRLVVAGDLDGDGHSELCGIASERAGQDTAVGIGPDGFDEWSYPLPVGLHRNPSLEMVASGNVTGGDAAEWLLAGADGSLHILTAEGKLVDHFHYGAALSGLAVADIDSRPVLLVATADGVDAWQVEP